LTWRVLTVTQQLETLGLMPVHPPKDLPRYIWYKGLRQTNSISDIITAPAFWQALGEIVSSRLKHFFSPQNSSIEDTSVAALVQRLLGSKTAVDVPISALMHGIWGGDPYKLSAISATGWLYDKSFRSPKHRFGRMKALQSAPEGSFYYPTREYEFAKRFLNDIKDEGRIDGFMSLLSQANINMAHVGPHGLESLPLGLADMLESAPNVELRLGSPVQHVGYSMQRSKVQVRPVPAVSSHTRTMKLTGTIGS
jgi:protoporphyrinogen oxidase